MRHAGANAAVLRGKLVVLCSVALLLGCAMVSAASDNLVKNPGFEELDSTNPNVARYWTDATGEGLPLQISSEHHEGAAGAMIPGDNRFHEWQQNVMNPQARAFTVSLFVKAVNAVQARDHAPEIYCYIKYKGRGFHDATHLPIRFPLGSYDWKKLTISGAASSAYEIESVQLRIGGRLASGSIYVDQVELTEARALSPQSLLRNKVQDLVNQLDRVGAVDGSVVEARTHLNAALTLLDTETEDLAPASKEWEAGAKALSHEVWAAMYPDAMSDKMVEVQMLFHGLAPSKEQIDRNLDLIELAGCNAVLHSLGSLQGVVYPSDIVPFNPGQGWEKFDALTYFIEEAHKRGIKVFGYLAVFPYDGKRPDSLGAGIAAKHPDWFSKGRDPAMETFLDPANPEVVAFAIKAYEELATKFDLDGVGLDYIRYPNANSLNYDERNRQAILQRYGIDILGPTDPWENREQWSKIQEYRHETISHVVEQVHDAIKRVKPEMPIIATVFSSPTDARDTRGQNWAYSAKWLDFVSPMNYNDAGLMEQMIRGQKAIADKNGTMFAPSIGGMPVTHQQWTISVWAKHVAMLRTIGCDGMIIYRFNGFDPAVAAFFGKGPFYQKATFPVAKRP